MMKQVICSVIRAVILSHAINDWIIVMYSSVHEDMPTVQHLKAVNLNTILCCSRGKSKIAQMPRCCIVVFAVSLTADFVLSHERTIVLVFLAASAALFI